MKYCTSYYQSEPVRQKIDELRFSSSVMNEALGYAERHSNKRVIVEFIDLHGEHIPQIEKLHKLHVEMPNVYYDFYNLYDLVEYARWLGKYEDRYIMYHQPALTWGLIQILLYYRVSDITLGEPLTFNMNELEKNVHPHARLRIRPYIAKPEIARGIETDPGIHHFWVLPQHMHLYEPYIDVLDLLDDNIVREAALVNTYTSNKEFSARLDTLIEGVECEIGASFIDDKFVQRRLTCGQSCLKNSNYCHFCDQYVKMYDVIAAQRKSSN